MRDIDRKIIDTYTNANEKQKEIMLNVLECAVTFGEPFYKEMQEYLDSGDREGMLEAIARYTAILKERATV